MGYWYYDDESALHEQSFSTPRLSGSIAEIEVWYKMHFGAENDFVSSEPEIWIPHTTPFWDSSWRLTAHQEFQSYFWASSSELHSLLQLLSESKSEKKRVGLIWDQFVLWITVSEQEIELLFADCRAKSERSTDVGQHICVAKAFGLDQYLLDGNSFGFRGKPGDNGLRWNAKEAVTGSFSLTGRTEEFEQYSIRVEMAANAMSEHLRRPCKVKFELACVSSKKIEKLVTACKGIRPKWNLQFFGEMPRMSVALNAKNTPSSEVRKYPVFQNVTTTTEAACLNLLVLACHTGRESYLQIYTQKDSDFLSKLTNDLRLVERV